MLYLCAGYPGGACGAGRPTELASFFSRATPWGEGNLSAATSTACHSQRVSSRLTSRQNKKILGHLGFFFKGSITTDGILKSKCYQSRVNTVTINRDWYHQSLPRRLLQQTADLVDGRQAWGRGAVMGFKTVATGGSGTP